MANPAPRCKRCNKQKPVKLRKQFAGNGTAQFMWYCTDCEHVADNQKPFIKKALVETWIRNGHIPSIDAIPIVNDYRMACEICGASGAEYHHWLPQCFADMVSDHSSWPGIYLCKLHHDEWHEIVTWYLPGRIGTERSKLVKERYFNEHNNGV